MVASCSAFSAAARCSAAATSMSCALVGFTAGGAGRGGPGTGPRPPPPPEPPDPPPACGWGRFGGAKGLAAGDGVGRGAAGAGADGADGAGAGAAEGAEAEPPPFSKLARSRRATGASTVLDADFTYSPSSCSFASTVLLSTPSSFASSCTRALPATTLLTSRPGGKFRSDLTRALEAWSSQGLHRVLMSVVLPCVSRVGLRAPTTGGSGHCVCSGSVTVAEATASASGPVSTTPVRRRARPKARRRSASARQAGSGCRCAPRPGRLRVGSGTALNWSGPDSIATNRSNSEDDARFRHPIQVRTGEAGVAGMPAGGVRRTVKKSTLHFRRVPRPVR
jgi:hypothetical protein